MENALSPREIQARIRAGATVEQVAQEMGVPAEQVEPFATPVLAERQHQVSTALASPVRRRGETGSSRTLEAVVDERLRSRGLRADDVEWDAWRTEDRLWVVVGHYEVDGSDDAGRSHFEPQWRFDPRARFSTALNDDARWLIGELPPVGAPLRRRGGMDPDAEPTVDLNDEMALIRATQDAAEMTIPLPASIRQHALDPQPPAGDPIARDERRADEGAAPAVRVTQVGFVQQTQTAGVPEAPAPAPAPVEPEQHALPQEPEQDQPTDAATGPGFGEEYVETELEQVDGVYDFVPSQTANLDTLYEMLSGFQEDSVNIYAGLDQLPPVAGVGHAGHTTAGQVADPRGAESHEDADDEPAPMPPGGTGPGEPDQTSSPTGREADPQASGNGYPDTLGVAAEGRQATPSVAARPQPPTEDPTAVATGWPATMASEREPETTLENPVDHAAARADQQPSTPPAAGAPTADDLGGTHRAEPSGRQDAAATPAAGGDDEDAASALTGTTGTRTGTAGTGDTATGDDEGADTEIADTEAALAPESGPPPSAGTPATGVPGADITSTAPAHEAPREPEQDALVEEPTAPVKPRPKTRKRASVPTWDEIMFGGPR